MAGNTGIKKGRKLLKKDLHALKTWCWIFKWAWLFVIYYYIFENSNSWSPVDVAFMGVHKTTVYKYSLSPRKDKEKTKYKSHLQKPSSFSQLKGVPGKEEVWGWCWLAGLSLHKRHKETKPSAIPCSHRTPRAVQVCYQAVSSWHESCDFNLTNKRVPIVSPIWLAQICTCHQWGQRSWCRCRARAKLTYSWC